MTEEKSLLDRALDVMVFAPVGLAADGGAELSHLAEKGRRQLEPQMAMAKVVGRLALAQLQREAERQVTETAARVRLLFGMGPSPDHHPAPVPEPAAGPQEVIAEGHGTSPAPRPGSAGPHGAPEAGEPKPSGASGPTVPRAARRRPDSGEGAGERRGGGARRPSGSGAPLRPLSDERPSSADLAIHGYDALSALQVVQRLAGLSASELEAVRTYETATRGRRTILARIVQLQGGSGG